jgi:hypothetical protein
MPQLDADRPYDYKPYQIRVWKRQILAQRTEMVGLLP